MASGMTRTPMTSFIITRLLIVTVILLFSGTAFASHPFKLSVNHNPGDIFQGIRLLGTLDISQDHFNGAPLDGLSGLGWDEDEQLLYAISDKGFIVHLKPQFSGEVLTGVSVENRLPLTDMKKHPLHGSWGDAEGLTLINHRNGKQGDTTLLISFEGQPRVAEYSPQGEWIANVKLPHGPSKKDFRAPNYSLEAITLDPTQGLLLAAEYPKQAKQLDTQIYSRKGDRWSILRPQDPKSAITEIESLNDGSVLMLERSFESLFHPIVISLRKTWLTPGCLTSKATHCRTQLIARLSSAEGWAVDNFEGLTRHRGNHYFMVSDNNNSWLQRSLLSYFEILTPKQRTENKLSEKVLFDLAE